MSVPVRRVRIIGKDYELHSVTGKQFSGSDHFGQIDYGQQAILYTEDQHEEQLKDTLLHECVHGIDYAVQAGLEERQVHALSSGLYAWMVENKKLVRWIIGDVK